MIRHFFLTLFALLGASLLNTAHATNASSVSYNALALTSSFPDEVSPLCKENFSKEKVGKSARDFSHMPGRRRKRRERVQRAFRGRYRVHGRFRRR